MQIDHVAVSSEEVLRIENTDFSNNSILGDEKSTVPRWVLCSFVPAIAVLPLLCLMVFVARIVIRHQPTFIKYAWISFFSALLIASGVVTSAAAAVFLSLPRMPAVLSHNIPDFDEREYYPHLPSMFDLDSAAASIELKPLVIIVSPVNRLWGGREVPSGEFGAGVLLLANKDGYLFATAKHVIAAGTSAPRQVMVSTALGMRALANVAAVSEKADLALIWISRSSGNATYAQPIGHASDGAPVFVIGHPEGLNYTLSTGIVSGLRGHDLQISAAISPGNSGGPVYDAHGNLIGIVSWKIDQANDANAENLGFATTAEAITQDAGWRFMGGGEAHFQQYVQALTSR